MNNVEALDTIFNFIPKILLKQLKKEGFYDPILSGKISEGAELYNHLSKQHIQIQNANYSDLAESLSKIMNQGSILQIGSGQGDLLKRLHNLNFPHIFGIEKSKGMMDFARERLEKYSNVKLFEEDVRSFNFKKLPNIDNVIINNFWGMISEDESVSLLKNLKECINKNSLIFIGPYYSSSSNEETKKAKETLKQNLNFTFSFPCFTDFSSLRYTSRLVNIEGAEYFILKLI